jgi:hypothetical protein
VLNAIRIGTVNVGKHRRGARRRELAGQLAADALSGSGDDRNPVRDAEITRVVERRNLGVRGRTWDRPCDQHGFMGRTSSWCARASEWPVEKAAQVDKA